jgi:hypothetical protein
VSDGPRFYEAPASDGCRSAPAALRNREPIAEVLADWLPKTGKILELASGTGEHVVHFAQRFPQLLWQPSDIHPDALTATGARWATAGLPNVLEPITLDASSRHWPIDSADGVLSINMVHISPWTAALGLLDGAGRLLPAGAPLILYGPWLEEGVEPAPSNMAFDADLKRRDPDWGLRQVEVFAAAAEERGLRLTDRRRMLANNLMLLFRRD